MRDPDADDCCGPRGDPRVIRRFDLEYEDWSEEEGFPEMVDVSARLLELLRDATRARPTVLEIGCGTGAVSVALLEMGATSAHGVDLSPASVEVARLRASVAGFSDRATFEVGHGAALDGAAADWVVVDRVLCCDGRPWPLLEAAVRAAGSRIAISVPESRGWRGLLNRPIWAAEAAWDVWRGGCRGFVHDLRLVEEQLAAAGFAPARSTRVGFWWLGIYQRDPAEAGG